MKTLNTKLESLNEQEKKDDKSIPLNENSTYPIINKEDISLSKINFCGIENPIELPFKANSVNELETYIIQIIKKEDTLNIFQKYNFTYSILLNSDKFNDLKEFYEEECHLSLLNWVWKERKTLKYPSYNLNHHLFHILALLNNILNIFLILPINSKDILDLKLFDKLNSIRSLIKNWNMDIPILNLIKEILDKWKCSIEESKEIKLNKKRNRSEDETEADSDINLLNNNIKVIIPKKVNNISNKIKKNICIDLSKNRIIYFDKNDIPSSISKIKNAYDPLL
jgi:hypothetical protein